MKFIIIGLGNFGINLGLRLCDQGHEVIGIDERENIVEEYKDKLTATVCLNSVDEIAMRSQPIFDVEAVIVAIGEDWAASIQTTALLKTLGVKRIVGRSLSPLHETVLKGLGIEEIINPEQTAAELIANHIISQNVTHTFTLTNDVSVNELVIPSMFVGQTTDDIDLMKDFGISLVAVKYKETQSSMLSKIMSPWTVKYKFDTPHTFANGDHIVICGAKKDIEKLFKLIK